MFHDRRRARRLRALRRGVLLALQTLRLDVPQRAGGGAARDALRVETPFPFKSLLEAYTEESWKAKLARDEEAAAEAERVRQEEEAAAAAEAERVRKEEEEAERAALEEELAKRRPRNLDEAVEHAVRGKVARGESRARGQNTPRERTALLQKIAALEAQMQ